MEMFRTEQVLERREMEGAIDREEGIRVIQGANPGISPDEAAQRYDQIQFNRMQRQATGSQREMPWVNGIPSQLGKTSALGTMFGKSNPAALAAVMEVVEKAKVFDPVNAAQTALEVKTGVLSALEHGYSDEDLRAAFNNRTTPPQVKEWISQELTARKQLQFGSNQTGSNQIQQGVDGGGRGGGSQEQQQFKDRIRRKMELENKPPAEIEAALQSLDEQDEQQVQGGNQGQRSLGLPQVSINQIL